MIREKLIPGAVCSMLCTAAAGCFTGVESTPRISLSDVRKQQAAGATPEQQLLADLAPEPPSRWLPGRRLRVDDDKIGLALTAASAPTAGLTGHDIVFESATPAVSLTGTDATEFTFHRADSPSEKYYYQTPVEISALDTLAALSVPFTIDLEMVERIDSLLRGRRLYVKTPAWYDPADERRACVGLRHVPIMVDSVVAGTSNYPAAVLFTVEEPERRNAVCPSSKPQQRMVYMTVGRSRAATRNFDVLFAFENPRKSYPEIKDDVWELIVRSRVQTAMSRDECRLALGAPPSVLRTPTYGGMREIWQYSDGVYLVFDDGYLSNFRL